MKKHSANKLRRQISNGWEQYGHLIVTGLCVAIIIGTAVWTGKQQQNGDLAEPYAASKQWQQSLQEAELPTPVPTEEPWKPPLNRTEVVVPYCETQLIGYTHGMMQLHAAADLRADCGEPVYAMHSGEVVEIRLDEQLGLCVTIMHTPSVTVMYAGLADDMSCLKTKNITGGQRIGAVGGMPMTDAASGTHLHLAAWSSDGFFDPVLLWKKRM